MTETPPKPATYEDVIAAPGHLIAEIIDGELLTRRRPGPVDGAALTALHQRLAATNRHSKDPSARVVWLRPEVHFGGDVVVPDLAMWHQSEVRDLYDWRELRVTPRWALELMAPWSDIDRHLSRCRVLASAGVPLLWRLDAVSGTLQTFENRERRGWDLLSTYGATDQVVAAPFADIEIDLGDLWQLGRHRQIAAA